MNQSTLQLTVSTDQDLIPGEVPARRVVEIGLQAPAALAPSGRPRLNLALVLDHSGSMSGEKLEYVKQAAIHALDLLQAEDHIALVAFDSKVTLISPSVPASANNRAEIKRGIYAIRPGGMTFLSGGWLAGCQELASTAQEDSLNRALLLTDGEANEGITDLEQLAHHARELSLRGISTTTFGVGRGFNEHLLEAMANEGGGNFYYIETPSEIPGLFAQEFKEMATVTARSVELAITLPPHVSVEVPGGWRVEKSNEQMRIYVGDLFAGRDLAIYLKLLTPPQSNLGALEVPIRAIFKAENGDLQETQFTVVLRYSGQAEVEQEQRRQDVLERFTKVDLAETTNEALKLERSGDHEKAQQMMAAATAECLPYVDSKQASLLQRLTKKMATGMDEDDLKAEHFNAYRARRNR